MTDGRLVCEAKREGKTVKAGSEWRREPRERLNLIHLTTTVVSE